jgi:hypothetical protein
MTDQPDFKEYEDAFMFWEPEDQRGSWNLTYEQMQSALVRTGRCAEDEVGVVQWRASSDPSLEFFFMTRRARREGRLTGGREPVAGLSPCDPYEAAEFAAWLRSEVIRPDAPVVFCTQAMYESADDAVGPLPFGTDAKVIEEAVVDYVTRGVREGHIVL